MESQQKSLRRWQEQLAPVEAMTPEELGFQDYSGLYRTRGGSIKLLRFSKTALQIEDGKDIWEAVSNPNAKNTRRLYEVWKFNHDSNIFRPWGREPLWIDNDTKLEGLLGRDYEVL